MGTHRTFENLQQSYFLGTTREIVERIRDLEAAGIQDMVLATCDYDLEQLERFASEIAATIHARAVVGAAVRSSDPDSCPPLTRSDRRFYSPRARGPLTQTTRPGGVAMRPQVLAHSRSASQW